MVGWRYNDHIEKEALGAFAGVDVEPAGTLPATSGAAMMKVGCAMSYCAQCGQPVADGAAFCGSCGAPVAGAPGAGAAGGSLSGAGMNGAGYQPAYGASPVNDAPSAPAVPATGYGVPSGEQPTQAIPAMPQPVEASTQTLPPVPGGAAGAYGAAVPQAPAAPVPPVPVAPAAPTASAVPEPGYGAYEAQPQSQSYGAYQAAGVPGAQGGAPNVAPAGPGGPGVPMPPAGPGVPVAPGVPGGMPGVPAPKKRGLGGGAIAAIAGGVMAVILVVALAFIIPNFTAVKMMLGFRPNNPLMVTYDALASLDKVQSTRFEWTADTGYDNGEVKISGAYSLGKSTDESMAYFEYEMPDYMTVRAAWQNGNVGMYQKNEYMSGLDWYGDMDQDVYYYVSGKQIRSSLRSSLGREWSQVILDTKDALVKNGKWDVQGAQRTFLEQSAKASGDDSYDEYLDKMKSSQPSDEESKEIGTFSMKFFAEELEKKDVADAIFPSKTTERSDSGTKLTYEFDLAAFSHELASYWQDHEDDYPAMRDYMIRVLKESNDSSRSEAEKALDDAIDQMLDVKSSDAPTLEIMVDYGNGRTLNELKISGEQDGRRVSVGVKLTDKGKVSVDDADVTDFMKDAKREAEDYGSSSTY